MAFFFFLLLLSILPYGSSASDELQPAPGVLLVAGTEVQDPRFKESVILLLSAGPGGAIGLIINKPTATRVSSLFRGTGSMSRGNDPLFYGGPVGGNEVFMLRRAERRPEGWAPVVDRVFASNSRMAMMDALMTARTDDEVRVFAGYSGWGSGQLEQEIRRGDWHLLPADAGSVFRRDMTKLWPELYRKSREIVL